MSRKTVDFILSLREGAGFRFHPKGNVTLLSTCFAVQALYLLDSCGETDLASVAEKINNFRQKDGLFTDPLYSAAGLSGHQDQNYLNWQFTFFGLIAADMLGVCYREPFAFLEPFLEDDAFVSKWLAERNWDNFWYCSNEIMFLLYFLAYQQKYLEDDARCAAVTRFILDYLDDHQDEQTGFWGNNVRSVPENGLFGAAHIYLFYDYAKRHIRFPEAIARTTLHLQRGDGLYGPAGGGACEEYDAVEVLARVYRSCPDMQPAMQDALRKLRQCLVTSRHSSGGYGYRLCLQYPVTTIKRTINRMLGRTHYSYSGWKEMSCDMYSPDIWGTYFRLLSVALVERLLDMPQSHNYRSYDLPGWGYLGSGHFVAE